MYPDPTKCRRDVLQLSEKIGFRCGPVVHGEHCESQFGEVCAEIAVELLVCVDESASVDVDVHRSGLASPDHTVVGQVQVKSVCTGSVINVWHVFEDVDSFGIMPVVGSR